MSNKINIFKVALSKYIEIDEDIQQKEKQIKELEKPIKELKKKTKQLENYIKNFIETNNIQKKNIKINNFKITYEIEEKKSNLTQKFVKDALCQYFNKTYYGKMSPEKCNEKGEEIFQFILNNRDTKEISLLKKIPL